VGSSGIRRRKPAHHLPKIEEELSPAEQARAFGNFRWSSFSPAGAVERVGFLARQARRRRDHPEWPEFDPWIRRVGWSLIFGTYLFFFGVFVYGLVHTLF
jgi:hypothetical protein